MVVRRPRPRRRRFWESRNPKRTGTRWRWIREADVVQSKTNYNALSFQRLPFFLNILGVMWSPLLSALNTRARGRASMQNIRAVTPKLTAHVLHACYNYTW
jgi:hypothetical protein